MRLELTNTRSAIGRLSRLATRAKLERKERFESRRVGIGRLACFQLHHFRVLECAGRAERRRRFGLGRGLHLMISKIDPGRHRASLAAALQTGTPGRIRTCNHDVRSVGLFQLSYRSLKSFGASYRIRTGVSALATPCLEPTGPTMRCYRTASGSDRCKLICIRSQKQVLK